MSSPASSKTMQQLFVDYQAARQHKLTQQQFSSFCVFFPTLMVTVSDGIIDLEEWEYVRQLARFMAKTFSEAADESSSSTVDSGELNQAYLAEVCYLIKFLRHWQDDFIAALKDYVDTNPDVKHSILDTMQLFAEASGGTSEEEAAKIETVKEILEIE